MGKGRQMGSTLIAFCLAASGCAGQPRWGSNEGVSPVQLPPRNAQADPIDPAVGVVRSQKPEGEPFKPPETPPLPEATPANFVVGQPAARVGATVNNQVILNEEVLAAAYGGLLTARDLPEPERTARLRRNLEPGADPAHRARGRPPGRLRQAGKGRARRRPWTSSSKRPPSNSRTR